MSGEKCERLQTDGVRRGHVDHDKTSFLRVSVVPHLHRRLEWAKHLFKERVAPLLVHPVPVNGLRQLVVGFGVEVTLTQIQDTEPTAADFTHVFTGGRCHRRFQITSSHGSSPKWGGGNENDRPIRSGREFESRRARPSGRMR